MDVVVVVDVDVDVDDVDVVVDVERMVARNGNRSKGSETN